MCQMDFYTWATLKKEQNGYWTTTVKETKVVLWTRAQFIEKGQSSHKNEGVSLLTGTDLC